MSAQCIYLSLMRRQRLNNVSTNKFYSSESIRDKLEQMKSEIRGEMKDMKERLDTLTASLEENKNEGQLQETLTKINTSLQFPERLRYQMCATFSLPDRGTQTLFLSSVSSDRLFCVAIFQGRCYATKCNIIDAKCIKVFNEKYNYFSSQNVTTLLAQNVVTHIVVIQT